MPDQQSDEYVLACHRPPAWTGGDGIDISRRKQRLEGDSTKPQMRGRGRAQTIGQSKQLGELVMKVTSVPETRVVLTLTRSAPAPHHRQSLFPAADPCSREHLSGPPCAPSVDGGGLTPRAGRCEGDCWGQEVDPAAGRSKTVLHVLSCCVRPNAVESLSAHGASMRMPFPPAVSDTASELPSARPAGNVLPSPPLPTALDGRKEAEKSSRKMGQREAQALIGGCVEKFVRGDLDLHLARLAASQANNSPGVGRRKKNLLLFCFHCLPVSREICRSGQDSL